MLWERLPKITRDIKLFKHKTQVGKHILVRECSRRRLGKKARISTENESQLCEIVDMCEKKLPEYVPTESVRWRNHRPAMLGKYA